MDINYELIAKMSKEQIQEAYRYQQLEYAIDDVISHIESMTNCGTFTKLQANLLKSNASDIAKLYLYKYKDSGLAENDVYENLIENYLEDAEYKNYMLISVFERDICTENFYTYSEARKAMVKGLQAELDKEEEPMVITLDAEVETNDFGIGPFDAWSNVDEDCNCDWKIIPLNN